MSDAERRCLTMVKDGHRYVFRYAAGQEGRLLTAFLELARSPESEFDFFDAAVLSYQMAQHRESRGEPAVV